MKLENREDMMPHNRNLSLDSNVMIAALKKDEPAVWGKQVFPSKSYRHGSESAVSDVFAALAFEAFLVPDVSSFMVA